MSKTKIKICGLTKRQEIDVVNLLRPDFVGFVFAPNSRRYIAPDTAAKLRRGLLPGILPVGVFVNEPVGRIAALLRDDTVCMAQLHGTESEEYIAALRTLTGRPLIQAFRIGRPEDVQRAVRSPADFILLDHGAGGTGKAFDWTLIQKIGRPFFLAGGLNAENVAAAIGQTQPYAVDVSSGVETDFQKDAEKMEKFVRAARSA